MADTSQTLHINADRLWSTLEVSSGIGPFEMGLKRLALTDEDKAMRDQFAQWGRDAGFDVRVDGVGNIFIRREGKYPSLPPVMMGSHLDTTIRGGRYDGILGVLSGLEVLRSLEDQGIETKRAVEVVDWTDEEGSRFGTSMIGSFAFIGKLKIDEIFDKTDADGKRFGDELERIGYKGETPIGGRDVDTFIELHIEQGPELYDEDLDIGLVVGSYSVRGFRLKFTGETSHVGPTPMDRRRNALAAAGYMIAGTNDIGLKYAPTGGKTTCAKVDIFPNIYGIVASDTTLTIDYRHPDPAVADQMRGEIEEATKYAADRARVDWEIIANWNFGNEKFSEEIADEMRALAPRISSKTKEMLGQAGHDAYNLASIAPTVMVFTPCIDGITHNTAEDIDFDRTVPGVELLLNLVERRANRPVS